MKRISVVVLCMLMLFTFNQYVIAENIDNIPLENAVLGSHVIIDGVKGILVDPTERLILLEKSVSRSFDTEERNNYDSSPIKEWLNTEFKNTLANNEWIKEDSISLLSDQEFIAYKEYLSDFVIGWLKDAMRPTEEPSGDYLFVENTWNYVKAVMNGEIVGLGYATPFYASPITLELKSTGYKLKKAFGKPRILVPEDAETNSIGEFSELSVGDKIRFANKWWTLVDTANRKILGEFDYLNQYVEPDEEVDEDFKGINTYQFSNEVTKYGENDKSISYYLKNDFKNTFNNQSWIEDVDVPTKEQYESWNGLSLGSEWLVFSEDMEEGTKVYLVTPSGLVGVNPGESYPIRALVKLTEGLFLEDMGNGYYQVTDDDGID